MLGIGSVQAAMSLRHKYKSKMPSYSNEIDRGHPPKLVYLHLLFIVYPTFRSLTVCKTDYIHPNGDYNQRFKRLKLDPLDPVR